MPNLSRSSSNLDVNLSGKHLAAMKSGLILTRDVQRLFLAIQAKTLVRVYYQRYCVSLKLIERILIKRREVLPLQSSLNPPLQYCSTNLIKARKLRLNSGVNLT